MDNFYQSQYGQDRFLNETFFKNRTNGVFLDIGAHDGKTLSNTFFFEKALNWKGLCIEPHPKVFSQLKENRNCLLVEGCAWNEDTTKKFRMIEGYSEMLSGLVDSYHPSHVDRSNAEVSSMNQTVTDIEDRCYDINKLLIDNNLTSIDFMSIDIEGGELEVLKCIDYKEVKINIILAENNYKDQNLRSFLESKGYGFIGELAIDDVFVLR